MLENGKSLFCCISVLFKATNIYYTLEQSTRFFGDVRLPNTQPLTSHISLLHDGDRLCINYWLHGRLWEDL